MTRDWKYMKSVLDSILVEWVQEPELRLGQLITNAAGRATRQHNPDIFYTEDEKLIEHLKGFTEWRNENKNIGAAKS